MKERFKLTRNSAVWRDYCISDEIFGFVCTEFIQDAFGQAPQELVIEVSDTAPSSDCWLLAKHTPDFMIVTIPSASSHFNAIRSKDYEFAVFSTLYRLLAKAGTPLYFSLIS